MQNLHPILDLLSVCNVNQSKRWDTQGFYFILFDLFFLDYRGYFSPTSYDIQVLFIFYFVR